MGGLMSITGEPEASPRRSALRSLTCSRDCSRRGVFAALRTASSQRRGPAGRGGPALRAAGGARQPGVGVHDSGGVPGRLGNRHPSIVPYELICTAPRLARCWRSAPIANSWPCAQVIGARAGRRSPRFVANDERVAHRDELRAVLAQSSDLRRRPANGRRSSWRRGSRRGRSMMSPRRSRSPSGWVSRRSSPSPRHATRTQANPAPRPRPLVCA